MASGSKQRATDKRFGPSLTDRIQFEVIPFDAMVTNCVF